MKERRLKERSDHERRHASTRQSLLKSISQGHRGLESQVLSSETQPLSPRKRVNFENEPEEPLTLKDALQRELDREQLEKIEQPLAAEKLAAHAEKEDDQEYYQQLQNLELRVSGQGGLQSRDLLKNKLTNVVASNSFNTELRYATRKMDPAAQGEAAGRTSSRARNSGLRSNMLRSSRSATEIKQLSENFGDLANLRKSRLLLNRHLDDKAKELKVAERKRGEQHDEFHKAIKNTG